MNTFRQPKAGFTLIEVMLGAMVTSMIALSIYLVFSQGLRVEKRLQQGSLTGKDFFWTLDEIARDLQRMRPYALSQGERISFDGKRDEISFVLADESGLEYVTYSLKEPQQIEEHRIEVNRSTGNPGDELVVSRREESRRMYMLVKSLTPLFKESAEGRADHKEVLSHKILEGGLIFAYLAVNDQGERSWVNEWHESYWPVAVRVDLTVLNEQQETARLVRDVFIGAGSEKKDGLRAQ